LFDAEKLEKIVNNLVSNAVKFTRDGGAVTVTLTPPACRQAGSLPLSPNGRGGWGVRVSDTGPGIPAEHLLHIFDRFYRVDEVHATEGTGIGLALTKELVELHHGTITVESTPGKGSVFTVILPIDKSAYEKQEIVEGPPRVMQHDVPEVQPAASGTMAAPRTLPADGNPIVLVVEDNADLRKYIREYMEPDYSIQEAENGKEGYSRAVEIVPDLVISDVMMPEIDGMELCRILKKDVRTSHVPIILLTARAGTDSKIEGLEIGADDYVTKPFDMKELLARVRNLIEQRRELRKKFSAGIVLKPGEVSVTSLDDALLRKIMRVVEKNLRNENFGLDELAKEACLSRRHLSRKLNALTNLSPAEFVQYVRLQRARELLEKSSGSIAEVAFQVGFRNATHFSRCFRMRFGVPPSSIRRHKA
jgi:DNA-binding response OmpR family regulator